MMNLERLRTWAAVQSISSDSSTIDNGLELISKNDDQVSQQVLNPPPAPPATQHHPQTFESMVNPIVGGVGTGGCKDELMPLEEHEHDHPAAAAAIKDSVPTVAVPFTGKYPVGGGGCRCQERLMEELYEKHPTVPTAAASKRNRRDIDEGEISRKKKKLKVNIGSSSINITKHEPKTRRNRINKGNMQRDEASQLELEEMMEDMKDLKARIKVNAMNHRMLMTSLEFDMNNMEMPASQIPIMPPQPPTLNGCMCPPPAGNAAGSLSNKPWTP